MSAWAVLTVVGVLWIALAVFSSWLLRARPRGDDVAASAALRLIQLYARFVHRLRIEGLEHVPARAEADRTPLIVLANHTSGADPLLIQAALPFEPRWLMGADMRVAATQWVWDWSGVIFVDRTAPDARGLREALRHLQSGGVLGVFPEGHIERPARRLLPFREGVGLLILKSGAPVLPAVIDGTPQVDPAWASLVRRSRARVRFLPVMTFDRGDRGSDRARKVVEELRAVFQHATGWPLNESRARFEDGRWWYADADGTRRPATEIENRR